VRLVVLPTVRHKYLDTVVHTFLSSLHSLRQGYDTALVCNAANAVFLPLIKISRARVAINVDGLEWKRKKWSRIGQWYYQISERLACRAADVLVSDARFIKTYYQERYGKVSEFIPYGAPTEKAATDDALRRFGLQPGRYFLYVSRFEPENNAHIVLDAFNRLDGNMPLVMVGDAPYAKAYVARLKGMANRRVVFTGFVFGRGYRELMSHAYCYIHATEVGGTHPALVEAMGLGNGVLVGDSPENREVVGDGGLVFRLSQPEDLTEKMRMVLDEPEKLAALAGKARKRALDIYSWDRVTDAYEALLQSMANGKPTAELVGAGGNT
jgi:glycosyltransferase involved in cell wall biosynthesis